MPLPTQQSEPVNHGHPYRVYLLILLLCLIPFQTIPASRMKSASVEEGVHLFAGTFHLATGRLDVPPGYPWLIRAFMALPVWMSGARIPEKPPLPDEMYPFEHGSRFLYQVNDADAILFTGRLMIIVLSIFLGWYVFRFSRNLSGWNAGWIALVLYIFCPNILAHSRLATLDLALTAFVLMAVFYYYQALKRRRFSDIILSATAVFLAVNTKYTGLLLFPILILISLVDAWIQPKAPAFSPFPALASFRNFRGSRTFLFLAVAAISLVLTNAAYRFSGPFSSLQACQKLHGNRQTSFQSQIFRKLGSMPVISVFPTGLPCAYLKGWDRAVREDRESDHPNWYMGRLYPAGGNIPAYFLTALLVKTPLAFLLMSVVSVSAGLFLTWKRWNNRYSPSRPNLSNHTASSSERKRSDGWILWIPCLVFFLFFSLACHTQLGLRLILPIFPFLYILLGCSLSQLLATHRFFRVSIMGLIGWFILSSLSIYPHHLAYFNELAGGPDGGVQYFADSNLDWGEDLKGLKFYMDRMDIPEINLVYYGPNGNPEIRYYGIRQPPPERAHLRPWAVSVTWLYYAERSPIVDVVPFSLKNRRPDDTIGHSIRIYHPISGKDFTGNTQKEHQPQDIP